MPREIITDFVNQPEGANEGNFPMTIGAVDLFCGAGGLTYGLEQAGIPVIAGYDIDPACRYPYEANNKARFVLADLADAQSVELVRSAFDGVQTRILAGCAPCQPFSTYTRSRGNDARAWNLVPAFARLVREIQPEIVAMENVPQLAKHPVFSEFVSALKEMKYQVEFDEMDCTTLGVPQTRKRLTLIASRLGPVELPKPTHSVDAPLTVRDMIGNRKLKKLAAGQASSDLLHRACKLSHLNLQRIKASKPGGTWRDWPEELRAKCHQRGSGETYPSVYGRMEWDKPSPTITTQCFGYGNGRFGHPEQDRAITLREAAILQTFPQHYEFLPPDADFRFSVLGRLIGNAVPPKLGEAVGCAILAHVARFV